MKRVLLILSLSLLPINGQAEDNSGGIGNWCTSCDDCCQSFGYANGGDSCESVVDEDGNCLQCTEYGSCRTPVSVLDGTIRADAPRP